MSLDLKKYKNPLDYPGPNLDLPTSSELETMKKYGVSCDGWVSRENDLRKRRAAWKEEENRIFRDFRDDTIREVGLEGHPAGLRAFEYAWDKSNSEGFGAVMEELNLIAYVITGE